MTAPGANCDLGSVKGLGCLAEVPNSPDVPDGYCDSPEKPGGYYTVRGSIALVDESLKS